MMQSKIPIMRRPELSIFIPKIITKLLPSPRMRARGIRIQTGGWLGLRGFCFGATFGLWVATYFLYRTTRQAVAEGQQAIAAAKRSADAGLLQAEAAIGSQRPFVYLSEFDLRPWHGDRDYKIHMQIKNYGRTPALRVRISLGRAFGNLPATPPYRDEGLSEFVIEPGGVYTHEPIWGFRIEKRGWGCHSCLVELSIGISWGAWLNTDFVPPMIAALQFLTGQYSGRRIFSIHPILI